MWHKKGNLTRNVHPAIKKNHEKRDTILFVLCQQCDMLRNKTTESSETESSQDSRSGRETNNEVHFLQTLHGIRAVDDLNESDFQKMTVNLRE